MSEDVDRYCKLVALLYKRSLSRSLDWLESPWTGRLSASIGNYRVELQSGEDADGSPIEIVYIVNSDDQIVDSFNDNELSGIGTGIDGYESYWLLMKRVHHLAYRKSKNSDAAIDSILDELDKDYDL